MIPAQNIVAWGAEDGGSGVPVRLKIEINTGEIEAFDGPAALLLEVANPWFSGETGIPTLPREEMMAAKLRALLQRDKGRAISTTSHMRSRSSRDSMRNASSRCSGATSTFPARPSRGHGPRSACSPSWPKRSSSA